MERWRPGKRSSSRPRSSRPIGRSLLYRDGERGSGLLATVRDEGLPRIHPITVEIVDGRLYAVILPSAKGRDLALDGRYALHAHVDLRAPAEFELRGRAELVGAGPIRTTVAAGWPFEVGPDDLLFEFSIDSALVGARTRPGRVATDLHVLAAGAAVSA